VFVSASVRNFLPIFQIYYTAKRVFSVITTPHDFSSFFPELVTSPPSAESMMSERRVPDQQERHDAERGV